MIYKRNLKIVSDYRVRLKPKHFVLQKVNVKRTVTHGAKGNMFETSVDRKRKTNKDKITITKLYHSSMLQYGKDQQNKLYHGGRYKYGKDQQILQVQRENGLSTCTCLFTTRRHTN